MTNNYYSICDVKRVIIEHALSAVSYEQTTADLAVVIEAGIVDASNVNFDENCLVAPKLWKYIAELVDDYGIDDEFLDSISDRYNWDVNVLDRVNTYRNCVSLSDLTDPTNSDSSRWEDMI